MLDLTLQDKVKRVIISHKDYLSCVGVDLFKYLFDKYGTEIIIVSDVDNPKTDEQKLFEKSLVYFIVFQWGCILIDVLNEKN